MRTLQAACRSSVDDPGEVDVLLRKEQERVAKPMSMWRRELASSSDHFALGTSTRCAYAATISGWPRPRAKGRGEQRAKGSLPPLGRGSQSPAMSRVWDSTCEASAARFWGRQRWQRPGRRCLAGVCHGGSESLVRQSGCRSGVGAWDVLNGNTDVLNVLDVVLRSRGLAWNGLSRRGSRQRGADIKKNPAAIDSSGLTFFDVMPLDRVHDCQTRLKVRSCAGCPEPMKPQPEFLKIRWRKPRAGRRGHARGHGVSTATVGNRARLPQAPEALGGRGRSAISARAAIPKPVVSKLSKSHRS